LAGLNLVGGYDIWCHYSPKDDAEMADYDNDLFILYEASGLFIQDNTITGIGKKFIKKAAGKTAGST